MLTIISTIITWAVQNKFAVGIFTFVGSKIFLLLEEYIKKRFFPKPVEVIKLEREDTFPKKRKVISKKNIFNGYALFLTIFILLGLYIYFTYQQIPYLPENRIVEEFEQIKLLIIMFTIFLMVKILNLTTTLKDMIAILPLIKKFIKK